jgi:hypothetical protein
MPLRQSMRPMPSAYFEHHKNSPLERHEMYSLYIAEKMISAGAAAR